jgi:site-specific DNA-methyltransferase (adenine-specific)
VTTPAEVISGAAQWCVLHADNADVLPTLAAKSVAHVITDPPYSERVHAKQWVSAALTENGDKRASSSFKELGFTALADADAVRVSAEISRLIERWSLVFCDIEDSLPLWRAQLTVHGLDWVRGCIWDKVDSSPQFSGDRPAAACEAIAVAHQPGRKRWNGGGRRNLFSYAINAERGDKPHPTTKPLPLMLELVELFTDPGDVVLDPFCGSGTTGVACIRLGRRFIGIERDAKYAAIAQERLEAEARGLTLRDARAGQTSIFDQLQPKDAHT